MTLLQTSFQIIRGSNTPSNLYLYLGIGFGVLVALIIIGSIVSRRRVPRSPEEQAQYSHFVFSRTAKAMGLPSVHADTLQNLVRACKVKQPFLVFSSTGLLDDVLRKGIYSIDNTRAYTEEEKDRRKAILYEIKQIIESNSRKAGALKSTQYLRPGQALTITPEVGGHFASKIVSNMKDFLTISAPTTATQGGTRWMRGTKLSVYFWRENDAGYSFPSKVLGYDTVKGVACVLIQHGKALRREQRRRARRKPIMRACFYYPIRITETGPGRRAEKRATVELQLRALGTVVDLSAGGCAVQAMSPFEPGGLVMIEFDIDKKAPIRAFGKVKRVRRLKGRGGIMHVMFTRVTRQYLNRIRSFVYDFHAPQNPEMKTSDRQ
jgi:c-di-GMP-binding flagellar brake protein YcgR